MRDYHEKLEVEYTEYCDYVAEMESSGEFIFPRDDRFEERRIAETLANEIRYMEQRAREME